MRSVIHEADLPRLAARCEAAAEAIVSHADGRLEVVDQLVRRVTFDELRVTSVCRRRCRGASMSGRRGSSSFNSRVRPRTMVCVVR